MIDRASNLHTGVRYGLPDLGSDDFSVAVDSLFHYVSKGLALPRFLCLTQPTHEFNGFWSPYDFLFELLISDELELSQDLTGVWISAQELSHFKLLKRTPKRIELKAFSLPTKSEIYSGWGKRSSLAQASTQRGGWNWFVLHNCRTAWIRSYRYKQMTTLLIWRTTVIQIAGEQHWGKPSTAFDGFELRFLRRPIKMGFLFVLLKMSRSMPSGCRLIKCRYHYLRRATEHSPTKSVPACTSGHHTQSVQTHVEGRAVMNFREVIFSQIRRPYSKAWKLQIQARSLRWGKERILKDSKQHCW